MLQVLLDRSRRAGESPGRLARAEPVAEQLEHGDLPTGQTQIRWGVVSLLPAPQGTGLPVERDERPLDVAGEDQIPGVEIASVARDHEEAAADSLSAVVDRHLLLQAQLSQRGDQDRPSSLGYETEGHSVGGLWVGRPGSVVPGAQRMTIPVHAGLELGHRGGVARHGVRGIQDHLSHHRALLSGPADHVDQKCPPQTFQDPVDGHRRHRLTEPVQDVGQPVDDATRVVRHGGLQGFLDSDLS